ncbi:hypothetical protein DV451_003146 [Geotrichum candidum]|uniref:Uncharacterized protein n=1 Tax=Geotrichum candidum TaxID=1173061 RepID=A0A9P5G5G7_GEOCN|nr:hypothetical protein DV451_003146 [Geotrichum candidum]KAF5109876.1 hypothetical protein DV453_001167 [Geotrichum candidum]
MATANIGGIESLDGDLIVKNITTLNSITAPLLANITGAFTLEILQSLTTVSFPKLTTVGDITFVTLNVLDTFQLDAGITKAKSLIISDTTIKSLEGISLMTVDTLNINNNKFLTTLDFNLRSVSNILEFSSTGSNVKVTFPYLQWANNITLRDVSSLSLPNVTTINSTLSFTNNSIASISVPKLSKIGGSLAIVANDKLANASFPKLETIGGGFQIANNTKLDSILGFPLVKSVGGAINIVGSFDNATAPSLEIVQGGVSIESDSELFNCSSWNDLQKEGVIRGDSYQCKAASVSTSVAITSGAATATKGSKAAATGSVEASTTASSSGAGYMVEASSLGAIAALLFQFL